MKVKSILLALVLSGWCILPSALAQITNTVFSENFSGTTIDSAKLAIDAPTFEGGKGDIAPAVHDGVVEFTGTVTEQWWAGATLRVVPTFPVSTETNVMVSVDRVSEAGVGTSSRSALWIMDSTKTYYVLFADNRAENHWQYNRKIGLSGDVPTGGGTAIAGFNAAGSAYLDEGQHQMKALANGKTVKLYLDGKLGAEVPFPFNNLVFQIGAYARANGDTVATTFDNLKVETIGAAAFSSTSMTMISGQTGNVTVRIPPGVNKTQDIKIRVVSSDSTVAIPVGAVGDTLNLTFAAGASNEQSIGIKSVGPTGTVKLTLANDLGMASANALSLVVIEGAGVRLEETFTANTIDSTKWTNSTTGFETGEGTFTVSQTGGRLVVSGTTDVASYWAGATLNTVKSFTATSDLPLSFEMDRVSIDAVSADGVTPSTAARTGVLMRNADLSQYILFAQNVGETGWEVNATATGSGTAIPQFAGITDNTSHRLKLVANGTTVELFLDGASGGSYAFPVNAGIYFDIVSYARDINDAVKGVFDNVKIENVYPPIAVSPTGISTATGVNTNLVAVTIPRLLSATSQVKVTVASSDPSVAFAEGASNGSLTLVFPAGGTNVQTFKVTTLASGVATLSLTSDQGVAVANGVNVTVTPSPVVALSDDFSASAMDETKWVLDSTPLTEGGTATADSSVFTTNGLMEILVQCETADWPGFALFTKKSYTASALSPVDLKSTGPRWNTCKSVATPVKNAPASGLKTPRPTMCSSATTTHMTPLLAGGNTMRLSAKRAICHCPLAAQPSRRLARLSSTTWAITISRSKSTELMRCSIWMGFSGHPFRSLTRMASRLVSLPMRIIRIARVILSVAISTMPRSFLILRK